nr:hypothetical protein CTI12_AA463200 [Tanacetum cinerariifolium]
QEYTRPPRSNTATVPEAVKPSERSRSGSDEEVEPFEPNAVPAGFTSRDAKVWEAKSKGTKIN